MNPYRILLLFTLPLAFGWAQTAREIVQKSEDLIKGTTCHGTFVMTVVTPEFTRTMEMESWWVANEKALIVIRSPKRETGNKTLKIKNEMWSYLKNTETTIKIPPSMMLQSWNGSDFTNDDLVRESSMIDDYTHRILGEEPIDGQVCWKLELFPKPEAAVVWGKLYIWVRKKDFLPSVVQFYDENGSLVRYLEYTKVRTMGGRTIPTVWTMYNEVKTGHHTTFEILDATFDVPISDRIFSFRELERGN